MKRARPSAALRAAMLALLFAVVALLLTACGQGSTTDPAATAITPTGAVPPESTSTPLDAKATPPVGSEGASPGGGLDLLSVDPCKLLTQDDVKSAMGDAPYAPRQMSQAAYHTGCSYVEPTLEENSPRLSLSLDSTDTWEFDAGMTDAQPVSGVGDAAQTRLFDGWRTLWVLVKNKAVVGIDIYPPDTERVKQLASKVIGRLP